MNLIKAITFLLCSTLLVGQTTPIRNPQIQGASGAIISGATLTNSGTFTNSGTLNGAGTFNLASGTVTMPAAQILTNVTVNGTITFADNIKQTFNPGATYVGINVGAYAGVPGTLANGDLWYDSSANSLKAQVNGSVVSIGAGGSISGLTSTRVPFATGATTLGDDADLTFATDTLSGTALKVNVTATTASTSSTTGALIVAGGVGINKDSWINGLRVGRGGGNVDSNTALGEGVMAATASGINNVAIGENVLAALLGGNRNMMIGHESGNDVTSGSENAGAGNQALYSVTTGNYNSGFGATTLSGVTTASSNTALGYQAGTYRNAGLSTLLANPSNSIYIGDNAIGYADSETNAIVIGSAAIGEGSNKTVIGNSSTTNARIYGQIYGFPINVKSYGAKGDSRKVTDAVLNGTTTVTSATAAFTSADTGKVVWGIEASSGADRLPIGTATYVNSTTITCSVSATGSYTAIHLVIGTDDTAEIQAAAAAADAMSPKGLVYIPSGGYVFSDRLFNQSYSSGTKTFSVGGDGSSDTILYPSPAHALTGGVVVNTQSNAENGNVSGITIDGSYYSFSGSPQVTQTSTNSVWNDVRILSFKGVVNMTNHQVGLGRFYNCHWEGSSYVGVLVAGAADFYSCYTGNHAYIGLHVSSGYASWTNGILDECAGPTMYVGTSFVYLTNALVYAGASQNAIETTGASTIKAVNSRFIPFGGNNDCTGLLLATSGTARLVNCILTGSGTGYGLNNSGTVYDVGGNTFTTTTGTAPVDALNSIVSVAHGGTGISSFGIGVAAALGNNTGGSGGLVTYSGAIGAATATTASVSDNDTSVATTAFVQGERAIVTKSTATNYTIGTTDSRELYGGVIYVTGAATLTIPAVASGASFKVITVGAVAVSVDPNASDLIYLNGTALADGDKITNTSTTGDSAVFTYYDATGWFATTSSGWTDGN